MVEYLLIQTGVEPLRGFLPKLKEKLLEALKAVPTEQAKLLMGTPSPPCIIVPTEDAAGEESYLFMVLPVRMSASWDK